jgi:AraC-like DNA-binding protein
MTTLPSGKGRTPETATRAWRMIPTRVRGLAPIKANYPAAAEKPTSPGPPTRAEAPRHQGNPAMTPMTPGEAPPVVPRTQAATGFQPSLDRLRLHEAVAVRRQLLAEREADLVAACEKARRPARKVILAHLLEVLLIEALRSTAGTAASPGLVRGLADERLAVAIRWMHESSSRSWTVAQLAKEAALSRSTFFERFSRAVGVAPMEYLLAWRMALSKNMLRQNESGVAEIAERVGYGSASAFSVAFTRHVGLPPARYPRAQTGS